MRTLEFTVKGQKLRKASGSSFKNIVMGSKNYLKAHFNFDQSWVGMLKVAEFSSDSDTQYMALRNDECMIPDSVTASKVFTVKIVGSRNNQLVPTTELKITQEEN